MDHSGLSESFLINFQGLGNVESGVMVFNCARRNCIFRDRNKHCSPKVLVQNCRLGGERARMWNSEYLEYTLGLPDYLFFGVCLLLGSY